MEVRDGSNRMLYQYVTPVEVCTPQNSGVCISKYYVEIPVYQLLSCTTGSKCNFNTSSININTKIVIVDTNGSVHTVTNSITYNLVTTPYSLSLDISGLPNQVSNSYLQQYGLSWNTIANLGLGGADVAEAKLYTTIYNNGYIVYQDAKNVRLNEGTNIINVRVPYLNAQGKLEIKQQLIVVLKNGQVLTTSTEKLLYVSNIESGLAPQIVAISPDLSKLKDLQNAYYNLQILIRNPALENKNIKVQLLVLDQYGTIVWNQESSTVVNGNSQETLYVPVNTFTWKPGEYTFILEIYDGDILVNERTYQVTVNMLKESPINVLKVWVEQYDVKPGQFIKLNVNVINNKSSEISVKPRIYSKELNLYQEAPEVSIKPWNVQTISFIIYVPEGLQYGTYPIVLEFERNGAITQYTHNLLVNGTKPTYYSVTATILGPSVLNAGENTTLQLSIKAEGQKIYRLKIEVESKNAIVYLQNDTLEIGGGYTRILPLNITAKKGGEASVNIKIVDLENGEVLYNLSKEFEVEELVEEKPAPAVKLEDYIFWVLVILALIIIASIIISSRKSGEKKKKVEE